MVWGTRLEVGDLADSLRADFYQRGGEFSSLTFHEADHRGEGLDSGIFEIHCVFSSFE